MLKLLLFKLRLVDKFICSLFIAEVAIHDPSDGIVVAENVPPNMKMILLTDLAHYQQIEANNGSRVEQFFLTSSETLWAARHALDTFGYRKQRLEQRFILFCNVSEGSASRIVEGGKFMLFIR